MAKKKGESLPWRSLTERRDLVRSIRWFYIIMFLLVTIIGGLTTLVLYYSGWHKLALAIAVPTGSIDCLIIYCVADTFWHTLKIMIELCRKVQNQLGYATNARIISRMLIVIFLNFPRGSKHLGDMAKILFEFEDRKRQRGLEAQARLDKQWRINKNVEIKDALETEIGAKQHPQNRTTTITAPSASLASTLVLQTSIPKRYWPTKVKSKTTVKPEVPSFVAKPSVLNSEKRIVDWEAIKGFDLQVIPEKHRTTCAHIMYFLSVNNLNSVTFKHESYDMDAIATFVNTISKANSGFQIAAPLKILVNSGLVRQRPDHHSLNSKRRVTRYFYKANRSPRSVKPEFRPVVNQLVRESMSQAKSV